jgi:hypothetical protein
MSIYVTRSNMRESPETGEEVGRHVWASGTADQYLSKMKEYLKEKTKGSPQATVYWLAAEENSNSNWYMKLKRNMGYAYAEEAAKKGLKLVEKSQSLSVDCIKKVIEAGVLLNKIDSTCLTFTLLLDYLGAGR